MMTRDEARRIANAIVAKGSQILLAIDCDELSRADAGREYVDYRNTKDGRLYVPFVGRVEYKPNSVTFSDRLALRDEIAEHLLEAK